MGSVEAERGDGTVNKAVVGGGEFKAEVAQGLGDGRAVGDRLGDLLVEDVMARVVPVRGIQGEACDGAVKELVVVSVGAEAQLLKGLPDRRAVRTARATCSSEKRLREVACRGMVILLCFPEGRLDKLLIRAPLAAPAKQHGDPPGWVDCEQ